MPQTPYDKSWRLRRRPSRETRDEFITANSQARTSHQNNICLTGLLQTAAMELMSEKGPTVSQPAGPLNISGALILSNMTYCAKDSIPQGLSARL